MLTSYIYDAVRTPFGRYGKGLAGVRPDDLAAVVMRAIGDRNGVDPAALDVVVCGDADQAGEAHRAGALFGDPRAVPPTGLPRCAAHPLLRVARAPSLHAA